MSQWQDQGPSEVQCSFPVTTLLLFGQRKDGYSKKSGLFKRRTGCMGVSEHPITEGHPS